MRHGTSLPGVATLSWPLLTLVSTTPTQTWRPTCRTTRARSRVTRRTTTATGSLTTTTVTTSSTTTATQWTTTGTGPTLPGLSAQSGTTPLAARASTGM